MKILDISYNNFMEIVKEKIQADVIKPHHIVSKHINKISAKSSESINKDQLFKEIKKFFKKLQHSNYTVSISFHEKTKTYVIKVIDKETKRVVREAPLEKILDIISFIEDLIKKRKSNHIIRR